VIAIDLALARRLALSVVLGQAGVTVIAALLAGLIAGPQAALSALLGGGISTAASLAMALLGFSVVRPRTRSERCGRSLWARPPRLR